MAEVDELIAELSEEAKEQKEKEELQQLLREYKGPDAIVSAESFYESAKKEIDLYKAYSGIPSLDKIVDGFRPGNLIVVSGITKQGKTTLCQTLTHNFTHDGFKCLWFSFDTPGMELIERFPEMPHFYLPRRIHPEDGIKWIEQKIIEGLAKYNTRIVFLDNTDILMRFANADKNEASQITAIITDLKTIAMRWNITIFLNHHIRNIDATTVPNFTHLKGSSGVGQNCDLLLMVWRERAKASGNDFGTIVYTNNTIVAVQLNRRTGKTGVTKVAFDNGFYRENDKAVVEEY